MIKRPLTVAMLLVVQRRISVFREFAPIVTMGLRRLTPMGLGPRLLICPIFKMLDPPMTRDLSFSKVK